jgi:hypothetical protein
MIRRQVQTGVEFMPLSNGSRLSCGALKKK